MDQLPRITVVIPCYNAERYVAAALRSVEAQAWPGLEIIVVDDGSTDDSAGVVARGFPGVRLLRQANQGVAAARNLGLAQATADWVAMLDADDLWLPGKLHAQWQLLQQNPQARMCYTAWRVWHSLAPEPERSFMAELEVIATEAGRWQGASGWVYPELLRDCVVWTSTVLAHRSVFDEVGGFDPSLRIGEDYDLWLRASRATSILRVARPYGLYRMHPDSVTKGAPDRNYKGLVVGRALERWGYYGPDGRRASKDQVRQGLARSWSDFAGAHLQAGHLRQAWEGASTALKFAPTSTLAWALLVKTALRAPARWLKL